MINPELKRNLWLSFSVSRLIAMPAILALTFLSIYLSEEQALIDHFMYTAAVSLFVFIVWLWGSGNASASITDEIRNKTWDQQRMSALEPWTMAWGKLFGATAFNWYGGLICLGVIAATGTLNNRPGLTITLLTLCAVGLMLHAAMIVTTLYISQFGLRPVQGGGMGWLIVIFVTFRFVADFTPDNSPPAARMWWGIEIDHALFWLYSSLLFAACFVFAAWRAMCSALQVRTLPWAWPAFACILAAYLAGFVNDGNRLAALLLTGLSVSCTMTYASLFSEPNTLLKWRKLELLWQKQDKRGWLENLPLWPTTLALALLFALPLPLTSNETQTVFIRTDFLLPHHALAFALMMLRDACILLFFAFAPNSKRATSTAMLYLFAIDMLLPFLAEVAGLDTLRYFLLPFDPGYSPVSGILIMTVHAAIAITLVNWRLRSETAMNIPR